MPFQRPDLKTIVERMQGDAHAALGLPARLRRGVLDVVSKVWAGAVHGLYGYGSYISRQILPWSADSEHLERHAGWRGIRRKKGTASRGQAVFSGQDGAVFPAGVRMLAGEMELQVLSSGVVDGGSVTVDVQAQQIGPESNLPEGTPVSLMSPVAGIYPDGLLAAGLTGGSDVESDASLLSRLECRVQNPPAGGCPTDYTDWAMSREKHGVDVTRVWTSPREMGRGTVTVRFMTDGVGNGIPVSQAVADVAAYIDTVRPATADVFVVAPVPVPLTVQIAGLNPATLAARQAVEAGLVDLIRRESAPGGTLLVSHIREAISLAVGEYDHELVSPVENVRHETGQICVFGGVQWV